MSELDLRYRIRWCTLSDDDRMEIIECIDRIDARVVELTEQLRKERVKSCDDDNDRLRGLLREAVEAWHSAAYRRTFLDWRGNMEWGKKAQAALEGKP